MGLKISRSARSALVIALHCSGAGAGQWRRLSDALGASCELIAPEHYGCESVGPWTGEHAFAPADEAARTIALIDGADRAVHLVGHSYGGGVALHVALARPERIASVTLYEPCAFQLLGVNRRVARCIGVFLAHGPSGRRALEGGLQVALGQPDAGGEAVEKRGSLFAFSAGC